MKNSKWILIHIALPFAIVYLFPWVFPNEYYIHLVQTFLITYIVIVGLNILVGLSGQLSLGHVGFYAIGAYLSGIITNQLGLNFLVSIVFASLIAAAFGAVVALLSLRAKGPYLAMVTIAFGELIGIIANRWVNVTGGPAGLYPKTASLFGIELNSPQYLWIVGLLAILITAGTANIFKGRYGRTFIAFGNSEVASEVVGINVRNWKVMAFALSAFLAGVGGGLFAFQNGFISSTTFEFDKSILFLIGVIVGGSGRMWGPVVGTVIVVLLPQIFQSFVDYHLMIFGGILLFSLVLLPNGIVGGLEKLPFLQKKRENEDMLEIERNDENVSVDMPKGKSGTLLELKKISMQFGGLLAVNKLDVEINGGIVHGIIGPNGSGKSTTVNVLSGVYIPTSGRLLWKGKDITNYSPHQIANVGITRTFQNLQLFYDLTVIQNIKVGFHRHYKSKFFSNLFRLPNVLKEEKEYTKKALHLLKIVGLEDKAMENAANLSYGEQRLVEIARALALNPELLILDEPAAGASPVEIEKINDVIFRLKEAGLSIILIEHHMDIVMNICDTITVLDFGKKISEGSPQMVQKDPKVVEAYLGGDEVTKLVSGQ